MALWRNSRASRGGIYTTAAGLCLSKRDEIQHFHYCKDTRVLVERVDGDFLALVWALGSVQVYEVRGGRNHTGSGFCRSRFYIIDDFTSHSDTPIRTDANWLIFYEETVADLFSCNPLSRFSQGALLFKFSCPSEGVRAACEVVCY